MFKSKKFMTVAAVAAAVAVPAIGATAAQARSEFCGIVQVSEHTSCGFAHNVEIAAYQGGMRSSWVYSPVTHRSYSISYRFNRWGQVVATGPNGIWLRFAY